MAFKLYKGKFMYEIGLYSAQKRIDFSYFNDIDSGADRVYYWKMT